MKISDSKFIGNIVKLMTGVVVHDNGKLVKPTEGVPQGSILSPILSNIYLHYVLDECFESVRLNTFKRNSFQVCFADDIAWVFENKIEAVRFYRTLPKRIEKYGLTLNTDKSSI